jgi:hypothetical protein
MLVTHDKSSESGNGRVWICISSSFRHNRFNSVNVNSGHNFIQDKRLSYPAGLIMLLHTTGVNRV